MRVILISGKAGSGKDTIGAAMAVELEGDGHKVLLTHYADLLKYTCEKYFGWDGEKDERGRTLLQTVGTDKIKNRFPTFWIDYISTILTCFPDEWEYVIIPDCRFPDEVDILRERGFDVTLIRVLRDHIERSMTDSQRSHKSENALDNYIPNHYFINNIEYNDIQQAVADFIKEKIYE